MAPAYRWARVNGTELYLSSVIAIGSLQNVIVRDPSDIHARITANYVTCVTLGILLTCAK